MGLEAVNLQQIHGQKNWLFTSIGLLTMWKAKDTVPVVFIIPQNLNFQVLSTKLRFGFHQSNFRT